MFWRNIIIFIWILALGIGGYFVFQKKEPCSEPLAYTLGFVDARHNISEVQFLSLLEQAEAVWEKPTNKNLFSYTENAKLKVNLIFDEKQMELLAVKGREETLDTEASKLEAERLLLESLQNSYEAKLSSYNSQVAAWNSGPRTNKNEFDRLKKTEEELNNLGNKLDMEIQAYNKLVQGYNNNVDEFNKNATFEEQAGVTLGNQEIDIFILNNDADDVFLIAHELGHAIGIEGHTDDQNSLMYYKLPENLSGISEYDIELLNNICAQTLE